MSFNSNHMIKHGLDSQDIVVWEAKIISEIYPLIEAQYLNPWRMCKH